MKLRLLLIRLLPACLLASLAVLLMLCAGSCDSFSFGATHIESSGKSQIEAGV
jgi:hypothetical protein